jgi:small basic protein
MWWLPILGLVFGMALGMVLSLSVAAEYSRYMAMAILAAFDSILGAFRAELQGEFDNRILASGFLSNIILAGGLTYLGDRLGVELYIAAVVALGVRMFNNLAMIRRYLLARISGCRTG